MKIMTILPTLFFCLVSLSATAAPRDDAHCFPGEDILFPRTGVRMIWEEPDKENSPHTILFQQDDRMTPHPFFTFERHVCLAWSPTEDHFSITDFAGSDTSTVFIYTVEPLAQVLDVRDQLPSVLKTWVEQNHHAYLEVLSWQEEGPLIRVWGYGDQHPDGFDTTIVCTKESTWRCTEYHDTSP